MAKHSIKHKRNDVDSRRQAYKSGLISTRRLFLATLVVLGIVGLLFFLRPDNGAKIEKPTAKTILNGEFTSSVTKWYGDTYPLHDQINKLNSKLHTLAGFTFASGIYKEDTDAAAADLKQTIKDNEPQLNPYIDENKKAVCLTFDDGPGGEPTERILKVLEKYNAHATFFVVGEMVDTRGDLVKQEFAQGCEVGNHTDLHPILTELKPKEIRATLKTCSDKVRALTGQPTYICRPTGGGVNLTVTANTGMPMINWSIDTLDWKTQNPDSICSIATTDIEDGDVILMHDLYDTTADAVEQIVPALAAQGFQFLTISEMAELKGIKLDKNTVYYDFRNMANNWADTKIVLNDNPTDDHQSASVEENDSYQEGSGKDE